jgi:tetratricopeptide (TPR) repeat protein
MVLERAHDRLHAPCMRVLLALLLLSIVPVSAQSTVFDAYQLWSNGQSREVIAMLEPQVTGSKPSLEGAQLGVAWALVATSYQTLEMYDQASRAYQKSLEILRSTDAARSQYAAVLDNLATMDDALGQQDAARLLCEKALHIYQQLGDHPGMTIAYTDLAVIAFAQNEIKPAQRNLDHAFAAATAGGKIGDDDVATMNSIKAALALHAGHANEAVTAAQVAIDHWIRSHGPGYFMLQTSYLVKARALEKTGVYADALTEARHALDIAENTVGRNSNAYLKAMGVVAEILKAAGEREEAARIQKEVQRSLADLHTRQCYGCTIDASGFRQAERNSYGFSAGEFPQN